MSRQYITTAIDYPNAAPHMGHVLEKVLADVLARWFRLRGDAVRFQIGTDEHGVKMQRAAEKEGVSPRELVDRNVGLFTELYDRLHISHDVFIRTSNEAEHYPTVQELWRRLRAAGVLEKRQYTGLYCPGCERFMTERDLENGLCPNHQVPPEEVTEENWFLKMSEYGDELKQLLTDAWDGDSYRIVPPFRAKETLSLIENGLEDVSFSRPKQSLYWGVPVPDDEDQTMYVWCDALTNYISGLDYFALDNENKASHERTTGVSRLGVEWWDDANVTHVIGKDIARFHALIWPLMLKKADIRIPDTLLIHGFLTSEGQKMSKSLGNVVKPEEVLSKCNGNPDPIRFYLSHEVPVGRDGDFSWDRYEKLYDSALRNNLGNLLNRVLVMLKKAGSQLAEDVEQTSDVSRLVQESWEQYNEEMNQHMVHKGAGTVMAVLEEMNSLFTAAEPWKQSPEEKGRTLTDFAEAMRHTALMLLPFIPDTACRISKQLGVPYAEDMLRKDFVITDDMKAWGGVKNWKQVGEPEILFQPLE